MATSVIRFTNSFSDETTGTVDVGPVDTSALSVNTIRANVKAWNERLASDTATTQLMQGKYGGNWNRISEVRITTTNRTYIT